MGLVAPSTAFSETNTAPWIRFTITAVELREVQGVRWLAIDYLDDVHGDCQKSFPWETTIPGFKAETRTSEFRTDAKDSSPAVRHQRIEYRMPDSSPRDQLERLRDNLEKALKQKSFRLELGESQVPLLLFELPGVEGGSLQARIKVVPPLTNSNDRTVAPSTNKTKISAELWTPKLKPGETPQPREILLKTGPIIMDGRYEEALQRHIWYHHHALEYETNQAGFRLSAALTQWMALARRYPKAKEALVEIRDRNMRQFSDDGGSLRAWVEISSINKALGEDYSTVKLFKSIQARNPALARQCYQDVEQMLVEAGDYATCARFIPDPMGRLGQIRAKWEKALADAREPWAIPTVDREEAAQWVFINETRALVEILVGVGRKGEAETIRAQALGILDHARLQSVVADAETRVAKLDTQRKNQ